MWNKRKKGELTIQGLLMAILISAGLFVGIIVVIINQFGASHNTDGFVASDISKYDSMDNISTIVNEANTEIDQVTPDPGAFDFFADIFSKIITPFKFIYRSFTILLGFSGSIVSDLNMLGIMKDFIITALTVLVTIGIVMIKFHMGRRK